MPVPGSPAPAGLRPAPDPAAVDAARGPRVVALGLAGLFGAFVPLHLLLLTDSARTVMSVTAALSTLALLAWWLWAGRRPDRVSTLAADLLGVVPLANCLMQLAVDGDLKQTTPLMLALVGVGAAVTGRGTALALCGLSTLAWLDLVRTLPESARVDLPHYTVAMLSSLVLAALLFVLRRRRESLLLHARDGLVGSLRREAVSLQERDRHEQRFRQVFQESPVGIGLSDEHGHFVAANAALCRLLGRAEAELLGRSSVGFTHPDDRPAHSKAQTLIANAADGVVRVEKRYVRPTGEVRWAWLTITRIEGPEGQPWTLAHLQDVTERKATEQELSDSEANLAAVSVVVRRMRTGADARHTITTALRDLTGAQSASIIEPLDAETLHVTAAAGPQGPGTKLPLDEPSGAVTAFRSGRPLFVPDPVTSTQVSAPLVARCGAQSLLFQPVIADGQVTGVLALAWDHRIERLTHRIAQAIELLADETAVALQHDQLMSRLAALATTDSLTGLPNRRAWDDRLGQLMARARRTGQPLTVAMLDLDHFKAFNDTHGHVRGDALLATTARRFAAQLREVDLLARWGGEEFAVALPDCDVAVATATMQRLRAEVSHGQTASVGHATWDGAESAEQLLGRADAALYDAKTSGRDRTVAAHVPAQREPLGERRSRPA